MSKPAGDLTGFALRLLLFEGVDELDGGEEADLPAQVFDGLDADGGGMEASRVSLGVR